MDVYDVVRADELDGGEHVLLIRQIKREIVRIPLEDIEVSDLDSAIMVKAVSLDTGEMMTYFLLPDEEVELWTA